MRTDGCRGDRSVRTAHRLDRTRTPLVREAARHTQRIQKTLEDANLTLTEVISNTRGTSGRAVLRALIAGESDPERLADRTSRRLTATRAELVSALHGRVTPHHRFMLQLHLTQIAALDAALADIEARIQEALVPFRAAVTLVTTMPGVSETAAAVVVAEIGDDMSVFPSAGHLLSWAGVCPRLDERAGTRRSTRTRAGAPWLKTTLVHIAWPAARKTHSEFQAQFLRLKSRRGPKKAMVAVAASMLTDVYYMLRDGAEFRDLGDQHVAQRDKTRAAPTLPDDDRDHRDRTGPGVERSDGRYLLAGERTSAGAGRSARSCETKHLQGAAVTEHPLSDPGLAGTAEPILTRRRRALLGRRETLRCWGEFGVRVAHRALHGGRRDTVLRLTTATAIRRRPRPQKWLLLSFEPLDDHGGEIRKR